VESKDSGQWATVGGGNTSEASGPGATVAGGIRNTGSGFQSTVAGGVDNVASGNQATVCGGMDNAATTLGGAVVGGVNNTASGVHAFVAGGSENTADGGYSFAFGHEADTNGHSGAVVFADSSSTPVLADADDEAFFQMPVNGSFSNTSSRTEKTAVEPVDPSSVLETVESLDVTTWEYKNTDDSRHMGPMAEDFHESFGLGRSEKRIGTVDADGVALAAIQGLAAELDERDEIIDEQRDRLDAHEAEIDEQRERIAALEETVSALRDGQATSTGGQRA
jgi:hypothetical protein